MEYISLSWSDIPELVVSFRISWQRVAANRETIEPKVPTLIKLKSLLRRIYGQHHDLINRYGISGIDKFHLSQTLPSSFPIHHQVCNYSNTTGATSGEGTAYPSGATEFTPVFSGVLVTRSLVFYVLFLRLFFVLFVLFLSHCIVCPSIYGFWLPLWYLQTLLIWRPLLGVAVEAVRMGNIKYKDEIDLIPVYIDLE